MENVVGVLLLILDFWMLEYKIDKVIVFSIVICVILEFVDNSQLFLYEDLDFIILYEIQKDYVIIDSVEEELVVQESIVVFFFGNGVFFDFFLI